MQDYFQTDTAVEKYQRGCESIAANYRNCSKKYKTQLCKCSENTFKRPKLKTED